MSSEVADGVNSVILNRLLMDCIKNSSTLFSGQANENIKKDEAAD